jgi:hypothetical protein
MAAPIQNLGLSNDGAISMDAERSMQFHLLMGRIMRQVQSLRLVSKQFPSTGLEGSAVDPALTVNAFCGPLIADLDDVYLMMENEDPKHGEVKHG